MRIAVSLVLLVACAAPQPTPQPSQPVALAIVYSGQWYWMGADDYVHPTEEPFPGAHHSLRVAIDDAFAALPRGSEVAIVSYSSEPKLRLPLVPVPPEASRVVGSQREYEPNVVNDLVRGIEVGLDEVSRSALARRAIVVIGDGFAVDDEAAVKRLPHLRALAAERRVSTFALVVPSSRDADFLESGMQRVVGHGTANVVDLGGPGEMPAALTRIVAELTR